MKHLLFACIACFVLLSTQLKAQNAANGITKIDTTFELGGQMNKNTKLKGYNGATRYNFSMDTFALLNYNGLRVDMEATDSVRLVSNKLVKLMSLGDIQVGATNSVTLDGNLWFKKYKKTSSNSGILSVDTCGRLFITSDINLNNYFKQGGNSFGSDAYIGTLDANNFNLTVNNQVRTTWLADSRSTIFHSGDLTLSGSGSGYNPTIRMYNASGHSQNVFWNVDGLYQNGLVFTKDGITADGGLSFSMNQAFNVTDGSSNNAFTFNADYYGQGGSNNFSLVKIKPWFVFNSSDVGTYRGLYIAPELYGSNDNMKRFFRSLEITRGNILLNTTTGGTGIGVTDTVNNSALLEVRGTDKGFLPPRLTTYNRNSIENPAIGLMVYNTDSSWLEVNTANGWYKLLSNTVSSGGGQQSRVTNTTNNIEAPKNTFVSRIGDGKTKTFTIKHNLNSEFVMVQFIDCGAEANCNLLLSIPEGARLEINGNNEVQLTFKDAPSFNRYKVMFLKVQ